MRFGLAGRIILLAVLLGTGILSRGGLPATKAGVALADTSTPVIVHYHRFAGDYGPMDTTNGWNLWMWPHMPTAGGGAAYAFDGTDAFGAISHPSVPGANTEVGIIVRLGEWKDKDTPNDRFIPTPKGAAEVWIIQDDPTIYTSLAEATTALAQSSKSKPVGGYLEGLQTAVVKFTHAVDLSSAKLADFIVTDTVTGKTIAVNGLSDLAGSATARTDLVQVKLAAEPDVTHTLTFQYQDYMAAPLHARGVLDDPKYFYTGSDLGATYTANSTAFRVWAPLATAVKVVIYDAQGAVVSSPAMTKSDNGTWVATVTGDLKNLFYVYHVTNFGSTTAGMDPYGRNAPPNGKVTGAPAFDQGFLSQVVDLSTTNPFGWSGDTYRKTLHPEDASLYEVHVRDFSINPTSGMTNRGKYLAFTESGTKTPGGTRVSTGVDSLKQLGITHVELLPTQRCASIDEVLAADTDPAANGDYKRYNWCYDPLQYNVLNAAYAKDINGPARINEYKQTVQSLHRRGLGLVQDVVYNHTSNTSVFDNLVPGYYYRTDYAGNLESVSCCPDVAAERPMVRKMIVDSVSYLMKEYHLDGFRFDLMSLLGTKTVTAISKALHAINPHVIILGEPWDLGAKPFNDQQLTQGKQQGLHVGVFNDVIRNGLEGSVFSATEPGFATGDPTKGIAIKISVVGNTNYNSQLKGFALNPDENINYVASHDNLTLWDRLAKDSAAQSTSETTKIRMDELAQSIVFTSQGVPFLAGGEEMLRTKMGNDNSYNAGDAVNQFDWTRKAQYASVFKYYSGLIALRNAHPAFRMATPSLIKSHLTFKDGPLNAVIYEITGHANKDKWKNIFVVYNPNAAAISVSLPKGKWRVVAGQSKIGTKAFAHKSKRASVDAYSMEILYQ